MSEPPALLTSEQFAERTGLGRTTVFAKISAGEIRSVKIGRLRRIPASEVERFVARLLAEQGQAA